MKKIIFIIIIALLTLTGCNNNESIDKEIIEEKINWYIEFDKDNDYIMCDNADKNIENGICYVGTYELLNGNLESDVSVALGLDHYYKDGGFHIVDISGPGIINLEKIEKYKENIVSIEKETNEVYLINIVDEIKK